MDTTGPGFITIIPTATTGTRAGTRNPITRPEAPTVDPSSRAITATSDPIRLHRPGRVPMGTKDRRLSPYKNPFLNPERAPTAIRDRRLNLDPERVLTATKGRDHAYLPCPSRLPDPCRTLPSLGLLVCRVRTRREAPSTALLSRVPISLENPLIASGSRPCYLLLNVLPCPPWISPRPGSNRPQLTHRSQIIHRLALAVPRAYRASLPVLRPLLQLLSIIVAATFPNSRHLSPLHPLLPLVVAPTTSPECQPSPAAAPASIRWRLFKQFPWHSDASIASSIASV